MSYFKAKMHQIRFRLGRRPRPRRESLQRSPDPLAGFKGATSQGRGGDGREGEGRGGEDKGGQGKGPERRGEGGKGKGEGERRDRGRGGREEKKNGDRPPTIFGLKVALGHRKSPKLASAILPRCDIHKPYEQPRAGHFASHCVDTLMLFTC